MTSKAEREVQKIKEQLASRILHIVDNFPKLSPSMLQISLGSGVPTQLWHGVLDDLVAEEQLYRYHILSKTPSGRKQTLTVIASDPPDFSDPDITEHTFEVADAPTA